MNAKFNKVQRKRLKAFVNRAPLPIQCATVMSGTNPDAHCVTAIFSFQFFLHRQAKQKMNEMNPAKKLILKQFKIINTNVSEKLWSF